MILSSFTSTISNIKTNGKLELLTKQTEFEAGTTIILKFSNPNSLKPKLYISSSYGTSIINPLEENTILNYTLPKNISDKAGLLSWKLLNKTNTLSGKLSIKAKPQVNTLETYLGPPSIQAGGTDFTMLVVIPTDVYDNPLPDSTQVQIKHQFLAQQNNDAVYVKNRISYKNIYSQTKSGRILISSEVLGFNSKEYTANVLPALPTDFKISCKRHHEYADGNQISTFSTSVIKDAYDNIVSDGTYVDFFITNTKNNILKTSGTTINGIATAKMIHPDHKENWNIKAFIEGMAESNQMELVYKSVIKDFDIHFSKNNRLITVGPLKSFMEQMVPDGMETSISIYKNDTLIKTLTKSTFEGYTTFKLDTNSFPNSTYLFKVKVAGIEKIYNNKSLW